MVVVGAGPAGSVAALCLARSGASVLLLERADLPRRKVCGGCVGPGALALLERLGVAGSLRGAGGRLFSAVEILAGSSRARLELGDSTAITRTTLDRLLVDAAEEAGAGVRDGTRVYGVRPTADGVEVRLSRPGSSEERLRAAVVVDASGLGGLPPVGDGVLGTAADAFDSADGAARGTAAEGGAVGTVEEVAPDARVGVGAVFAGRGTNRTSGPAPSSGASRPVGDVGPAEGVLRMVVGRGGYVGMVTVEGGRLNVAAALDRPFLAEHGPEGAVRRILAEVRCTLPDNDPELGWKGTPALTRRPASTARTRVFRVGDAAGYVEPFTGEGIGWAVSSGILVAPFVLDAVAGRPEAAARGWRWTHDRLVARRQRLCRALVVGLRRPRLAGAVVAVLSVAPALADPLVCRTRRAPEPALAAAARLSGTVALGRVS